MANAEVRVTKDVAKGDPITAADFSELTAVELTDDDPNAGHITIIAKDNVWLISFNFQYNAKRVSEVIAAAEEFFTTAKSAFEKGHYRPFVDNLFSAVELLAKATLLPHYDKAMLTAKSHKLIKTRFNQWSHLGNVENRFAKLLNGLEDMRKSARYSMDSWGVSPSQAEQMLSETAELLRLAKLRAPSRRLSAKARYL